MRVPISPHPLQLLLPSNFFIIAIPSGCEVVSRGIDLHFPDDWWYWAHFMCLLSRFISFLEKCPFESFVHLKISYLSSRCWILRVYGTSLVAQWLRIRLPVQGTRVWVLLWEDPTCRGGTKPVRHNYWACALEPASHNYWAHVLQLLKSVRLEPVLCSEKPPRWEARALQQRVAPVCHN